MDLPRFTFDEQELIALSKSLGITELYIFGSVLRSDFSAHSDIDLLVELDASVQYSFFDLMEIREKYEAFFGRNVDLIEKRSLRNPYRRESIVGSARKVYAA